jgi:hypothetical protein
MTTQTAIRQELHEFIDLIPERNLSALKPLLKILTDEPLIIETDLTEEEMRLVEQGRAEYRANPNNFIPIESILD